VSLAAIPPILTGPFRSLILGKYSILQKYNPIEHRVFPYVTKALDGIILDKVETVKEFIETRAKTKIGLEVFTDIIDNIYQTGKKATESFLENMRIVFDKFLPK